MVNRLLLGAVGIGFAAATLFHAGTAVADGAVTGSLATSTNAATVLVDARDAARGLVASTMSIPVQPGPFELEFPRWIPAEDGPTGPISHVTMLRMSANGKEIPWSRDHEDLYKFHLDVPTGVNRVNVQFSTIMNDFAGVNLSDETIAIIDWNRHVFYQSGVDGSQYYVQATIELPNHWDYATALPVRRHTHNTVEFDTVTLAKLVDSPLDCGRYSLHGGLGEINGAPVFLDVFADEPADLAIPSATMRSYYRMLGEVYAMYGSRHFGAYHSLVTLSDRLGVGGLDHHESGEEHLPANFMTDPTSHAMFAELIPHEFSHSWNGDYRAAVGLASTSFETPLSTDLIWVREGLNTYLGDVLAYRSGMRPAGDFPEFVAAAYAELDTRPGRESGPIIDLATGIPVLSGAWTLPYQSLTRPADLYLEGELIWFDVDSIIRSQTGGKKSIDDFLRLFAGKPDTGPVTSTYTRSDVEELLNGVAPYDWHAFFEKHVYGTTAHPPADEISRVGWRLVYTSQPNNVLQVGTTFLLHTVDAWYSLGLWIMQDGTVQEVRSGSIAWQSGIGPLMRIIAVDGQKFSPDKLDSSLRESKGTKVPVALKIQTETGVTTVVLNYHGGPKYPHLVRVLGSSDMLEAIAAPRQNTATGDATRKWN